MPKEFRCLSCGAHFDPGPEARTVACPSCGAGVRLDVDNSEESRAATGDHPASQSVPGVPKAEEKRGGCALSLLALAVALLALGWPFR